MRARRLAVVGTFPAILTMLQVTFAAAADRSGESGRANVIDALALL